MLFAALGVFSGLIAGMFGLGGGILLVPLLIVILADLVPGWQVHMAVGTSLAAISFTAINSAWRHHLYGSVDWRVFSVIVPALGLGVWLGARTAIALDAAMLRLSIATALTVAALQMWFQWLPEGRVRLNNMVLALMGLGIGWVSCLAGISGGMFTMPLLLASGLKVNRAVGTAAACNVPTAMIGALFLGLSPVETGLAWSTGLVYWPAVLGLSLTSGLAAHWGARMTYRMNANVFRRSFALVALGMASWLAFG